MSILWRIRRWAQGLGHSRGFGIQSPWAYELVTEVLCQPMPYYAYDDLQAEYPKASRRRQRLCQLYLRLANYRQEQPWTIVIATDGEREQVEHYLQTGCQKARVTLTTEWPQTLDDFPQCGMLVVEDIGRSRSRHKQWLKLLADPHVVVSFDLLDCGICFFDRAKNTRHYVINP